MPQEIIYEKKYPREELPAPAPQEPEYSEEAEKALEEFWKRMELPLEIVPMPQREQDSQLFIQAAREVAELYELDVKIIRYSECITADFSFDCGGCMKQFKQVFSLADDFHFYTGINNRELTIRMDYYTHALTYQGRILEP